MREAKRRDIENDVFIACAVWVVLSLEHNLVHVLITKKNVSLQGF